MKWMMGIAFILGFWGCSGVKYIQPDTKDYVSAGIDYNDLKNAVDTSLKSLAESPFLKNLSSEKPQVLAVSDFINDTTFKLDMEQLSARLIEGIQQMGHFQITRAISGSGGYTDAMIKNSRNAREDEEFNQQTTLKKGNLVAPNYSLTAKVGQRITKVGKGQRVDYFFKIEIVDLQNGLLQWSKIVDISKIASSNASVW